jgi:hypothetical protein
MAPAHRSRSTIKVKIFRSLLLLSLLESILWSLCLFHSASSCGLAYYQRETVRARRARTRAGEKNPFRLLGWRKVPPGRRR